MSKKYDTFSAYLGDVYYNQIFSKIKSYVCSNKDRLNLSTSVVLDPSYVELSDFQIMGVSFHEADTDKIEFKATIRADIEVSGRGRRDYESDSAECWVTIPFSATLKNGLQNVKIGFVSEYSKELFRAEDALTKFLVPYIYAKDLDAHAEKFLEKYCPQALTKPMPLPITEIIEAMELTVYPAPLPDGIFGRTYFNDATVTTYTDKTSTETVETAVRPGTILVNPDVFFMRNIGSVNNTIIHECVHWDKHYKFFELQKLLNPEIQAISCAVVEEYKKKPNELEDELSWMEWQANALAPKILIPAKTGREKLSEILNRLRRSFHGLRDAYVMELAISEFADFFKVSTTAAKIRAVELGFEQAAGVFNFVDGRNYPPFSFSKGSLKKGQTFIIDRNNIIFESHFNADLAADYQAGRFIHANGLFVINDPKYVTIVEDTEPALTEYALDHVDECCLVFDRTTRVSTNGGAEKYSVSLIIPKSDKKTVDAINAAVDAAIEEGIGKFGGKKPNKAAIKLPLRDGDIERDDEAYADSYFVNANSTTAPQIVDQKVQPILDRGEVYSGCYARVSINFYAFNSNGNKGIACGLGNIQKVKDGEPLGGKRNASEDFGTIDDDEFLA